MIKPLSQNITQLIPKYLLIKFVEKIQNIKENYQKLENEYWKHKIEETAQEVGSGLWIGGKSEVNSKTVLGDNVHFWGMSIEGKGRATIGDNFHGGSGCVIFTDRHNYDNGEAVPYDETFVTGEVEIGDNVWFGINVTVLSGNSIGEGAIIQAGSVVTEDIPKGAIAGGHPAKVFDKRDMEHYKKLKSQGRFN